MKMIIKIISYKKIINTIYLDPDTIEKIEKSLDRENISDNLRFLNFISIHRGDMIRNNFENIGFILLSGNTLTQKIGWHKEIKKKGNVPLVTNLRFLTTKLWFKLNKGFGANNFPNSFDIITKAQIVLSSQLNASVGIQFEVLQEKYKKEELSEEEAIATIVNLRKQAKKPEDIVEDDISNVLDLITEDKIERYISEQEHFKNEARKEAEKNIRLKKEITQKQNKIDEYEKSKKVLSSKIIETKEAVLKEKLKSIEIIENHKSSIDRKINITFLMFRIRILGLLLLSYGVAYFLIWKYGWNYFEQWTWIISVSIPLILSVAYLLLKEKTLNPVALLRHKKNTIKIKKYNHYKININLLNELKSEVELLKEEINELKSAPNKGYTQ